MTMTPVDHLWSLTLLACLFTPLLINATPINRQVGISENVFITVQNDTYGIEQRVCSIDSMTYGDGETIPTSSPCEHCICRPPGFACTIISCEYRPGCKSFKRSNQCCPEYQCECEKDGKIYQNGEKIMDSNNPCEICYCQGGEIICAVIDCYWRSDCQPRYIENRCCPLYDHCPPPSNQGPFPRPTIPTTTTSSGFPWFNLSSAVYEIPMASSVTPYPLLESSTTPTTTPIQPELVVVATEKTQILMNILATAQEESLNNVNDTDAIAPADSQLAQQIVEIQAEIPSVPVEQKLQETIALAQNVDHVFPVNLEVNEAVSTNEQVDATVPGNQEMNETVFVNPEANETVSANLEANDTVPLNTKVIETEPVVAEVKEPNSVNAEVDKTVSSNPEIINDVTANEQPKETAPIKDDHDAVPVPPEVNETIPAISIPEINKIEESVNGELDGVPTTANPEVNDNVPALSNPMVHENVPVNDGVIESVTVPTNTIDSATTHEEVIEGVNVNNEVKESLPVHTEIMESVPVHSEVIASVPVPTNVIHSVHVNDEVKESVPVYEEVKESAPVNDEVKESATASDAVKESVPAKDTMQEMVEVKPEIIETLPISTKVNENIPVADEVPETFQSIPEVNDAPVEVQATPDVTEIVPVYPVMVDIGPLNQEANDVNQAIPEIIPEMEDSPVVLQPSAPSMTVKDSTTLFVAPAISISIIPSPVEEIIVSQQAAAVEPEVLSQVVEQDTKVDPPVQESISQSENVIPVDKVVYPTQSLSTLISPLSSVAKDKLMPSKTTENIALKETISPSTVVSPDIEPTTVAPIISDAADEPTTTAPQEDLIVPSVAFDEVPQLPEELDQTTVKDNFEAFQTESPIINPIPSIATILMPPKREQLVVEDSATDAAPVQDQKPDEGIEAPSVELKLPTEEFVSSDDQSELEAESPTTVLPGAQENKPESEPEKIQDESVPVKIQHTYLPVPQEDEKVISDEATLTTTPFPSLLVESDVVVSEPKVPENIAAEPPVSVGTEFFEDSPVHIQGSDSFEAALSTTVEDPASDVVTIESEKPMEDSLVESVTETVISDHTVMNESHALPEIESTAIPQVVVSFDQVPSLPVESSNNQKDEDEKVQDESVTSTPIAPEEKEIIPQPEQIPSADINVPQAVENVNTKDNTFEIIPPESQDLPSPPEILNQIRDKEDQVQGGKPINTQESVAIQQDDAIQIQHLPSAPTSQNNNNQEEVHVNQNDAPIIINDVDTIEIYAENHIVAEETTQTPQVDKKSDSETPTGSEPNSQDDTMEILAGPISSLSDSSDSESDIVKTTSSPVIPAKEEEYLSSEDEQEEIHPDDQHEDDQDQVILTTMETPSKNDEAEVPTTAPLIIDHQSDDNEDEGEAGHQDEPEQEDETNPITTIPPPIKEDSDVVEINRDESDNVQHGIDDVSAFDTAASGTTTEGFSSVQEEQNDDASEDSQSPMTTTVQPAELMNKVQKVVEKLKSKDEPESISAGVESKFRLDLSAFDDSEEEIRDNRPVKVLSSSQEEVQSTPTPLTKFVNDDVVFDEAQQIQTEVPYQLPPVESLQDETTPRMIKLSRDDIESSDLTTSSSHVDTFSHELQDEPFSFTTTNNPGRSENLDSDSVVTTKAPERISSGVDNPESEENFINDDETIGNLGETTTLRGSFNSLRQDTLEGTTVSSPVDTQNETTNDAVVIRSDVNTNFSDFVELPTGSPLGFAAEYQDDPLATTLKGEYRGDSATEANDDDQVGDATTTGENIIFDEELKSQDESVIPTTQVSSLSKAKSESLSDDGTTPTTQDDLLNDESSIVTTVIPSTSEHARETSTTAKTHSRIDQMIIPEKGFPQIDPVVHEMIPRKEDKLARLDINDDDSWFYQTFNKIRQLSGLFPTPNRQKKLTRQPRDVSHLDSDSQDEQKTKTYFRKTKKATEEDLKKSIRRKSFLPSRSFLFF